MMDALIEKAKPQAILKDDFMVRLKVAISNAGRASIANPFASAAGWTLAGLVATFAVLIAIGRIDLLPDIVAGLVRLVGGS
jgi:hypothetical protein